MDCKTPSRKTDLIDYKSLSNGIGLNFDEYVTVESFIQSCNLGNCGMIAPMATLVTNEEVFNRVVPKGQRFKMGTCFDITSSSKFTFNLYKNGRHHCVNVNDILPFINDRLVYSTTKTKSVVGPLLEKALVQLLFDGNYELSKGVAAYNVFTSLTNNFCETFSNLSNDLICEMTDVINHGITCKSLVVMDFKAPKYGIKTFIIIL